MKKSIQMIGIVYKSEQLALQAHSIAKASFGFEAS